MTAGGCADDARGSGAFARGGALLDPDAIGTFPAIQRYIGIGSLPARAGRAGAGVHMAGAAAHGDGEGPAAGAAAWPRVQVALGKGRPCIGFREDGVGVEFDPCRPEQALALRELSGRTKIPIFY